MSDYATLESPAFSRSLRGNVDRNENLDRLKWYAVVVPYVGTWIEILILPRGEPEGKGRSLRGNVDRNLAYLRRESLGTYVVPYVGTWIEMLGISVRYRCLEVVPYVGTWIEILSSQVISFKFKSFPTWERG